MASTPLILTLTVLTGTILVLLILWVFIRYTKDRRARSQSAEPHPQLEQDITYAAGNGGSREHLHCTYQPSGAPHGAGHHHGAGREHGLESGLSASRDDGIELQTVKTREDSEVNRAEVWLKRGASKDNLKRVDEEDGGAQGTKRSGAWEREGGLGAWDMVGGRPRGDGLEGAGRR